MLNFLYLTGDLHGQLGQLENFKPTRPFETGIVLLGDSGANYYLNKRDAYFKNQLNDLGYKIYIIRGNHDARPEDLPNIMQVYDSDLRGIVYWEEEYPNIRYLLDGGIYTFKDKKILTIGGAYSIDKFYRLAMCWRWFDNEQLSEEERNKILSEIKGQSFDFILTHTCPTIFQPTDLFLTSIDQTMVDNSMEVWLNSVLRDTNWKYWCFGHYHEDRIISPQVFMLMHNIIDIEMIDTYSTELALPEHMRVGPQFFNYERE